MVTLCYIGLGSNMGDRQGYIRAALQRLDQQPEIKLLRVASLYETAPWGNTNQQWFLNTVAELDTTLSPQELLQVLLAIESELGRVRVEHWGPRTIDLDLLLYGQEEINLPQLVVPHPRMTERAFVLVPLAELCPDMVLREGQSVQSLARQVALDQEIRRIK
ncbi:2-amino-4-hydroxy-6-hydroxymethyldihydropteridine pyrophosphokinase [Desulfotomaculum nigrificans CO-1-SRB]|uniref:2-amino-4-hydroxy-6-hydroxymethyldihydropteridine diphosphokinase n=1 Tax=Desulfotomaculum nigrificans (strain DSM 14880 / VKM B-2319 / CO-1-SRB) TaxID=868595 RepID=F6B535_DESCC|nr:2-amino-4-hydroxy-6-hydroxymethyldihydropteridine diphosphokinase [Desulfotomaculum nigrificans]AEF93054.1 2-amino-4-hydroxy-6-hydroxymethyldihydropteridine pyrophosphokinase [Desulfotomaculum nigrificans CO-1-SRB]